MSLIILNFHGIGPVSRHINAAERHCWLDQAFFESVLDLTIGKRHIRFTFDDGNASDLCLALPALCQRGLSATFFICSGKLDQPTFLRSDQIRELKSLGMGIGSHGIDHVSWRQQPPAQLQREIERSRDTLQQICSAPIYAAACPFGDYNRRVLKALKQAGYLKVYTSDGGTAAANSWLQARTTITRASTLEHIKQLINRPPRRLEQILLNFRTLIKSYR